MHLKSVLLWTGTVGALALMTSCQQEEAVYRPAPAERVLMVTARQSSNTPGGPVPQLEIKNPYENNVQAIAEGRRLFTWYNCSGCHAPHGGGGMGPPLMDNVWIYGGAPDNIYASIVQGRPNGMPSWGGRIPEYQIWELVAYIRTLSAANGGPILNPLRTSTAQVRTAGGPR